MKMIEDLSDLKVGLIVAFYWVLLLTGGPFVLHFYFRYLGWVWGL